MAGIVFLKSQDLDKVKNFYLNLGSEIWIDQGDCIIFRHDNFLFGFCKRGSVSKGWLLTFFYRSKQEVDDVYTSLKQWAVTTPMTNEKYNIYNFYATDPEGRELEFQTFLHKIDFNWEKFR